MGTGRSGEVKEGEGSKQGEKGTGIQGGSVVMLLVATGEHPHLR